MDIKKIFGQNVKKYRKAAGFTQMQFAELIDVEQKHVSFIENGNSFPSSQLIARILDVLNISPDNLFQIQEQPAITDLKNNIIQIVNNSSDDEIARIYNFVSNIYLNKTLKGKI